MAKRKYLSLRRRIADLEERIRGNSMELKLLKSLRADPLQFFSRAGLVPDPWQQDLLLAPPQSALLLCSRQAGKSTAAAALALRSAILRNNAPVLVLSPSERQSGELFRKIADFFNRAGRPIGVKRETNLQVEFVNGSRILALPGNEGTVRGFSGVSLLVVDEAARVPDSLYIAVRPMLAVSRGHLIALSTPCGKRGWFHDEWFGEGPWKRVQIRATDCPRITAEFLAEERRALGDRYYRQEYLCEFNDTVGAVFRWEDIEAAISNDVKPLFAQDEIKPLFGG